MKELHVSTVACAYCGQETMVNHAEYAFKPEFELACIECERTNIVSAEPVQQITFETRQKVRRDDA